jgi:hypothetical protein
MRRLCPAAAQQVKKTGEAWLRIYGGPEAAGLLAAAAAFGLVHLNGGPLLGAALAGAWAEDVAFVGYFAVRAIREQGRHHKHRQGVTYYLLTAGRSGCGTPSLAPDSLAPPPLSDNAVHKSLAIQSARSSIMHVGDCFRLRYQWFAVHECHAEDKPAAPSAGPNLDTGHARWAGTCRRPRHALSGTATP